MKRLRPFLAAAVLLLPLSLFAGTVAAPSAFDRFMGLATGAGKTTVTLASDGTPLAAPGVPTITTDGGLPKATATGSITNPAGNRVPVSAVARVPAAEIGAATGRMLVRLGLKAAAVIGAGVVLYDFAKEINFILSRNPDGTVKVEKFNPDACTVAPCFTYRYSWSAYDGFPITTGEQPTLLAACLLVAPLGTLSNSHSPFINGYTQRNARLVDGNCLTDGYDTQGVFVSTTSAGPGIKTPVAPSPSATLPSSQQEFIDAVAA
jgi:hypothetical protein